MCYIYMYYVNIYIIYFLLNYIYIFMYYFTPPYPSFIFYPLPPTLSLSLTSLLIYLQEVLGSAGLFTGGLFTAPTLSLFLSLLLSSSSPSKTN